MCCLFGIIDYGRSFSGKQKTKMLSVLAKECEVRGTDATGIAYVYNNGIQVYKRPWPARRMRFRIPRDVSVIMGHTRMTTQGRAERNQNNHPWVSCVSNGEFALAHNGVLHNDWVLRKTLQLPDTNVETDSYVAVQLIEQQKTLDFSSLQYMAETVEGSFCFTVLDGGNQLWLVKGDNPLCLYHYPKLGLYLYASTEEILSRALTKMPVLLGRPRKVELRMGDILKIDGEGQQEWEHFNTENLLCRDVFFPWSHYWGRTPSKSRKYSAEDLYLEDLKTTAQCMGYEESLVDAWLQDGFTTDEIEEFLYCGEI